jgi:hypothetical protein
MTDEPTNTGESLDKPPKKGTFVKGFDPRRNIKGVPKDTLLMRKHMRQIAAELIGKDESEMTRLDAMLRQLWTSRNPAHNKLALQVLDPKILTEQVDVTNTGETKHRIEIVYVDADTDAETTPSAKANQAGTEAA